MYCWKSAWKTARRSSATRRKPSKSSAKFSHRSMIAAKAASCSLALTVCGGACGAATASIETACCRRPLCCVVKARCGTRLSVHTPRSIVTAGCPVEKGSSVEVGIAPLRCIFAVPRQTSRHGNADRFGHPRHASDARGRTCVEIAGFAAPQGATCRRASERHPANFKVDHCDFNARPTRASDTCLGCANGNLAACLSLCRSVCKFPGAALN